MSLSGRKIPFAVRGLLVMLALLTFASAARSETLDWNTRPATNLRAGGTDSPTYGAAPTLLTVTTSGSFSGTTSGTPVHSIDPGITANGFTGLVRSEMDATTDDGSVSQTTIINFTEPVYNVSFTIIDIDGGPTYNSGGSQYADWVDFSAISATGATVLPTTGVPVNAANVSYTAATGRAAAIGNIGISNNQGNITVTFAGPIRTLSIRHIAGANSTTANPSQQFVYVDTVTFTRAPQLRIRKTSNGGVGTFNFDTNNVLNTGVTPWAAQTSSSSVVTTVAGTAVNGAFVRLFATGTATTITETGPTGWIITSSPVTCTDSNSAVSGNPASFSATVAGYVVTVDATNVRAGAIITCAIINGKRPTLQVVKQSVGNTGAFSFSGSNGFGAAVLDTALSNPRNSVVTTLTAASTITTVTETIPVGWTLASATCTGMGAGGTASLAGNVLTLNAAATAATANIVCTFTNNKTPVVRVQKITTGGFGGPFEFAVGNLATVPADIDTVTADLATPGSPTGHLVSTTGSNVTLGESFSLAWLTSGVTCTDSNATTTGNPTPVATSAGANVTILGARVVNGADITCVFTNAAAAPQLAVTKVPAPVSVDAVGQNIAYAIGVSNPGNVTLTNVILSDALGSVVCPPSGTNVIASLAPGNAVNCTFAYAATQSDFDSNGGGDGDIDNTAGAASTYNGNPVTASASAAVALVTNSSLSIEKTASPLFNVNVGGLVTYTFKVTNTGNQTLTNITVSDSDNAYGAAVVPGSEVMFANAEPATDSSDGGINGSWDTLGPNDVIQFTATYQVVQQDVDLLQ